MFGKLFKPRANYVFDYKPRYYSERKERLQKLDEKYHYDNESKDTTEYSIQISKSNLRNEWKRNKHTASNRGIILRMAIIISILVGIIAYLFEIHKLF